MTKRAVGSCGSMLWIAAAACALLAGASRAGAQTIWYVDDDAPPWGDGLSWGTAFRYLQDAYAASHANDEIRVAEGVYRPDLGGGQQFGDTGAGFGRSHALKVIGGFAGLQGSSPDECDPDVYVTLVTGDLAGNDDLGDLLLWDNSLSLFNSQGTPFLLSGFVIERARDVCVALQPGSTLTDCVVRPYRTGISVSGLDSAPSLVADCRVHGLDDPRSGTGPFATRDAIGLNVGFRTNVERCLVTDCATALMSRSSSYSGFPEIPDIRDCSFVENGCGPCNASVVEDVGSFDGFYFGTLRIHGCEFAGNDGGTRGVLYLSDPDIDYSIEQCVFIGNSSQASTLFGQDANSVTVIGCTLWGNAAEGSVIAFIRPLFFPGDGVLEASIRNSIIRENFGYGSNAIQHFGVPLFVSHAIVSGGWPGIGNLDADPLFVDPLGPDGFPYTGDEDLRLLPGSPAIDAANSAAYYDNGITCDFDGNPRFHDDPATPDTGVLSPGLPAADIGAFEYRKSPPLPCVGDVNGDCLRDTADLGVLLGAFGQQGGAADLNGDGIVDTADLGLLLGQFGVVCP